MKMQIKKYTFLMVALVLVTLKISILYAVGGNMTKIQSTTDVYYSLVQDVHYPKNLAKGKKLPVVFLIHNGLEDKASWGDFPQEIARQGFFTVNLTWKNWGPAEVETAIKYTLDNYKDMIDTNRVILIGGCHGGKDALQIIAKKDLGYKVKTAVVLSVSEDDQVVLDSQKEDHCPILAYYALNDELGPDYQRVSKKIAEEIITEPKKVIAVDESAHGSNLVSQADSKDEIRKQIIDWIKEYSK